MEYGETWRLYKIKSENWWKSNIKYLLIDEENIMLYSKMYIWILKGAEN